MKGIIMRIGIFAAATVILYSCSLTPTRSTFIPTVKPIKTLIPTREGYPQLTPFPVTYRVITRAGQELQFSSIMLEPNEYVAFHTESIPQGIPIASGVEISFDYISQVDFGKPSSDWDSFPQTNHSQEPLTNPSGEVVLSEAPANLGIWPISITLTDNSIIKTSLGFKARHQIHLSGNSNYGYLDILLTDILKIKIEHTAESKSIPSQLIGGNPIIIETLSGDMVSIANPRLFTNCMYNVYCCHGEDLSALPLEGTDILIQDIKSVRFSKARVSIIFKDGRSKVAELRTSIDCPGTSWRLRGKTSLGSFELPLALISKIEH
jgi:hypothetical protein